MIQSWKTSAATIIYRVLSGRINSYLVSHSKGLILVDCGFYKHSDQLIQNIRSLEIHERTIDYLLLTHTHFDHCQSAAGISKKINAQIIVHSAEAYNLITGNSPLPNGVSFLPKLIVAAANKLFPGKSKIPAVEPNILVQSRTTLFGTDSLQIIHTPGHSTGSISLLVDDEIAICGDAAFGVFPNRAMPLFADDIDDLSESWGTLLETNCQLFLPGHGRPISRKTLEREFKTRGL
jgi:hydroxyacylglutathione hydrolase